MMELGAFAGELQEPGNYAVTEAERWSKLSPRPGQVILCKVPWPIAHPVEGAQGAFVVVKKVLRSDGSLDLLVKSLGSSNQKTTTAMSSTFNRKAGHIHLCLDGGYCQVTEGIALHVQALELHDSDDLNIDFVGVSGRRMLKQVLEHLEEEALEPPLSPREEEKEKERYSPEVLSPEEARRVGKGRGDGFPPEPPPEPAPPEAPKVSRGAALRERLEVLKQKELHGRAPDVAAQPADTLNPEGSTPNVLAAPHLRSGQRLLSASKEIEELLRQARTKGQPEEQVTKGPTSPSWMMSSSKKAVGSQLALRAAANSTGLGSSPPGGAGGSAWPGGQKKKGKKKKKKKKDGRKKKKKKRSRKGPGGGGSGGGSSSSSSSSSESSSSSASGRSSESGFLPPLKRKSEHRPGSVLQLLLSQIEENLAELQGADTSEASVLGGTKVVSYYHLLLKGNGMVPSSRDGRELYLLSVALDMLRLGMLDRVGDALAARFLSIQQAVLDGHWGAARFLEIHTPEMNTAAGAALTLAARRHARVIEKARGVDPWKSKGGGGRNSWGNKGRGDWHWTSPEEGDKSKGKKGKSGKGKGGTWNGKTKESWTKSAEREKDKKTEESK